MLRKTKELNGYRLGARDGEIGKVKEFLFDDQTWAVRYLVADTGGWLTSRKILISPHALGAIDDANRLVHVHLTRDQVEKSPSLDADKPVSRQFEMEYHKYFGWHFHWSDLEPERAEEHVSEPEVSTDEQERPMMHEPGNPHLRDTRAVTGYHIQARDGEVGHVGDFIIDDAEWVVRYLVVETRNWLPGKMVLVSTRWIDEINWPQSKVFVHLERSTIKNAPEYEPAMPITREYEERLFKAYDKLAYWV